MARDAPEMWNEGRCGVDLRNAAFCAYVTGPDRRVRRIERSFAAGLGDGPPSAAPLVAQLASRMPRLHGMTVRTTTVLTEAILAMA
jgi:hypothetical protein